MLNLVIFGLSNVPTKNQRGKRNSINCETLVSKKIEPLLNNN